MTEADKQSSHLKMTAEIDDLNRTKMNLEERLIELLKYDHCLLWFFARLSVSTRRENFSEERCH